MIDVLTGMRVFVTVVDSGSFSAAPGKLDLSSGMTSRHVAQMWSIFIGMRGCDLPHRQSVDSQFSGLYRTIRGKFLYLSRIVAVFRNELNRSRHTERHYAEVPFATGFHLIRGNLPETIRFAGCPSSQTGKIVTGRELTGIDILLYYVG